MSSVELLEIEVKIIQNCKDFLWEQNALNYSKRILEDCETLEEIKSFLEDCENNIKGVYKTCKISWNNETRRFSGDEFGYIFYFYSNILSSPIKLAVKIDIFDSTIVIGNIEIASKKEEKKLRRDLEKQIVQVEKTTDLKTTGDIKDRGKLT